MGPISVGRVRKVLLAIVLVVGCIASVVNAAADEALNARLTLTLSCNLDASDGEYFALMGAPVTFNFLVSNIGDAPITGISVDEPVLGHVGDIASLAPGESQELSAISESADGELKGHAAGKDPAGGSITASDALVLERYMADSFEDDPWVLKTSSKATAVPGDTITYTLKYGNQKDHIVEGAKVVDEFDSRVLEVVDAAGASVEAGRLMWVVGPGMNATEAPRTITYTMRLRSETPATIASALNVATISSEFDVDATDNTSRVSVAIDHYLGFTPPAPTAGSSAKSARKTVATPAEEPFLPYTGTDSRRLVITALLFAIVGGTLRRFGTTQEASA
ncbi:MAG: DUF11 domain-containing protein [Actinobacteria bacterium]|nr:DUF11 domain-containing protein [Actinomycetota bacterium]MCG2807296.1 DUF11 domain-containing protein [Coriobacteriia bacterium]